MSIEQAIYTIMANDAGIALLVGDRVYPSTLPEGQAPTVVHQSAVTYKNVSGRDEVSNDTVAGQSEDRWQITAWGETHAACLELFALIKGLWGRLAGTYGDMTITETYIVNRGDVPDVSVNAGDFTGWGKFIDVMISY